MRVVCDNCGAVYKIADSKLSKDVNKATCKRCGHKIIIYKGGGQPSDEDEDDSNESEERTVIKSVEGLDKLGQSSGSAPQIGSLTAELRAISLPGIQPVAPPKPATLGPVPTPILPLSSNIGIPPKDSPATAVYGGPRAAVSQLPSLPSAAPPPAAPPLPIGLPPAMPAREEGDKTRPMSQPPGPAPALSPAPAMPMSPPPNMMPPPVPSARPNVVTPQVPPAGPVTQPQRPGRAATPPAGRDKPGPAPAPIPAPASTAAPAPAGTGSSELGMVAVLGALALLGTVITAVAPAPASTAGLAVAAIGAASCLFLPLLSQRGRRPGQMGVAIFLGLLIGSAVGYLAHNRAPVDDSPEATLGGSALDPVDEPATTAPIPAEPTPEAIAEPPTEAVGALSPAEQEEARRFASAAVAATPTPAARPSEPSTPASTREAATPAPKAEPTPSSSELTRPKKPVGPGAPPDESEEVSSGTAAGPSPFVIDTIIRNNANVNRCFQLEKARGTDISGKIYLKFSIAPDGVVSRARITTSRFAGTALDQCVSKEVNDLKFPSFEGETQQVRYPFNVL